MVQFFSGGDKQTKSNQTAVSSIAVMSSSTILLELTVANVVSRPGSFLAMVVQLRNERLLRCRKKKAGFIQFTTNYSPEQYMMM